MTGNHLLHHREKLHITAKCVVLMSLSRPALELDLALALELALAIALSPKPVLKLAFCFLHLNLHLEFHILKENLMVH